MDISDAPIPAFEVIAEIGVNHNGSLDLALELVEVASRAGATTAKFQVFRTEEVVTKSVGVADYQRADSSAQSQFQLLKELELGEENFIALKNRVHALGMAFLATPDDYPSLRFLVDEMKVDRIKIGSGEVTNYRFLAQIAREGLPMILSTGMSTIPEVQTAIEHLGCPNSDMLVLLHCTSSYPTELDEANIRAITTMSREFPYEVGFSDHTEGSVAAVLAFGLGSRIFEKHITTSQHLAGPDHKASSDPDDFRAYVNDLRAAARAIGTGQKKPTPSESVNIPFVRRRIVAGLDIPGGTIISNEHVKFLRAESGLSAEFWSQIEGSELKIDLDAGTPIEPQHFS